MKKIALYSFAILALFACQREADFQVKEVLPTYSVTIQAGLNADTKTSYTQEGKFSWAAGDKIGVVAVKGEETLQATGETQDAKPIASFNVDVPEGYTLSTLASYPYYSPDAEVVNDLRYDAAKKGWALSADTNPDIVNPLASVPLIGTQDINGYYQFVTATGIVKFTVVNVPSATEFVELKGVEGAALAGVFEANDKGVLTMAKAIDAKPAIRNHNSPKGVKNTTMDFYFFVPEGSLAEGTELRFCNAEGAFKAFPFKSAVEVPANKIVKIDTLKVEAEPIYNRQTDSLALVAIYNAADGANWTKNKWDLSKPVSTWSAVTVSNERVTALKLTTSGVVASEWTLPKEVANLTALTDLRISSNKLTGDLPDELYGMTQLEKLYFQNDNLTGSLSSKLGQLTELVELYVDRNANMTGGIPKEIGQLKKLDRINISQTGISGPIPEELGQCESMTMFMAFKTSLSGELPDIWDMPKLQTVMIHTNPGLTGNLPASLGKLKPLAAGTAPSLQLYGCSFTGNIPASFAGLPENTKQVYVQNNMMMGRIPVACQNHKNFGSWKYSPQQDGYELWLDDRLQADSLALVAIYNAADGANWTKNKWDLSKPVSTWSAVTVNNDRVTALKLTVANVIASEWTLPKEVANLTALTDLRISSNKLTGDLPDELYGMTQLEKLYFQNDNLTGSLSSKLGQLTELVELYVDRNANMTGGIPAEIGQLKKLARINVSQNLKLGGAIPAEIGNCESLIQFMAFKTALSGELPDVWDMPALQTVMLHTNPGLTGNLPSSLSKLKTITSSSGSITAPSLQLHGCNFTGNIPESFANMYEGTKQVFVQGNQMDGVIPAAVQAHKNFSSWKYSPQQDGHELKLTE